MFSKKSSEFLFCLILFSAGIYLLKDWLKRSHNGNIIFLFLSSSCIELFRLIETASYFSKTSILTNKAPLVLIFFRGLHITCRTYYNLSIKAGKLPIRLIYFTNLVEVIVFLSQLEFFNQTPYRKTKQKQNKHNENVFEMKNI